MAKLGLFRSLLLFGVLQAVSNLTYAVLATARARATRWWWRPWAWTTWPAAWARAAFVALLMSLCDRRYTATQFALLSAASSVGRVFVGPPSGIMVASMGWAPFFFATFLIAPARARAGCGGCAPALPADPQPAPQRA